MPLAQCFVFAPSKKTAPRQGSKPLWKIAIYLVPPQKNGLAINFFAFAPQTHCIKDKKTRIKIRVFGEIRLVSLGQNFPFVFLDALEHRHAV